MARISGVNIPSNKKIQVALTYIFGIGPKIAENICTEASIDTSKRVNQLNDDEVNKIIEEIIENNEKAIADFKSGKETALGFLIGQAMKATRGRIDANNAKEIIIKKLNKD